MKRLIDEEDAIRAICKNCYAEDGGDYKDCRYYPCDDVQAIEALPSTDVERIKVIMKEANEKDKAEHMGRPTDLISRADALAYPIRIDHYDKEHGNRHFVLGIESVMEYIENLPSAEAVQGWIPCSERLPDERQDVYVTVLWDDYGDYITAYGMRTRFGWHLHSNAEGELIKGYTVIAWMPLPKPYKGGDE